jgi:hypothetical protein
MTFGIAHLLVLLGIGVVVAAAIAVAALVLIRSARRGQSGVGPRR